VGGETLVAGRGEIRVDLQRLASSAPSRPAKSISGGQIRCNPCSTRVAPSAYSRMILSSITWSATSAPAPPLPV
jgi:hypothetical protein